MLANDFQSVGPGGYFIYGSSYATGRRCNLQQAGWVIRIRDDASCSLVIRKRLGSNP